MNRNLLTSIPTRPERIAVVLAEHTIAGGITTPLSSFGVGRDFAAAAYSGLCGSPNSR